jgi:hypothetical protein
MIGIRPLELALILAVSVIGVIVVLGIRSKDR